MQAFDKNTSFKNAKTSVTSRLGEIGSWKIALGLVLYAVLLVFHHRLFGAHALI